MMKLRGEVESALTPYAMERIRKAPKPTPVSEVLAVVKDIAGIAMSTDEIAEVINLIDPGRAKRARASDYLMEDLRRNKELVVTKLPSGLFVRYAPGLKL